MLGQLYEMRLCFFSFSGRSVTGHGMERYARYSKHRGFFFLQLCIQCLEGCLAGCFPNEQKMLYNTPLRFAIGKGEVVKVG